MRTRFVYRLVGAAAACVFTAAPLDAQEAPRPKAYALTADLGYVSVSGNQQLTTMSLGDKFTYKSGFWLFTQQFNAVYSEASGTANAEFYRASGRADVTVSKHFTLFSVLSWDRNRFGGIKNKFEQQVGANWRAVASTADSLNVDFGGGFVQQGNLDGSQLDFAAGRVAAAYKHKFNDRSYLAQANELTSNLQDTGDWRANSETAIVAPLSKLLSIKLAYLIRYQARPPFRPGVTPAERFKNTDYVFTTGVQVTF
jgi:putative salt-induced outer membrane protein YdiY